MYYPREEDIIEKLVHTIRCIYMYVVDDITLPEVDDKLKKICERYQQKYYIYIRNGESIDERIFDEILNDEEINSYVSATLILSVLNTPLKAYINVNMEQ